MIISSIELLSIACVAFACSSLAMTWFSFRYLRRVHEDCRLLLENVLSNSNRNQEETQNNSAADDLQDRLTQLQRARFSSLAVKNKVNIR